MKRWFAVLLSVLLLVTSVLPVSASGNYNDDYFDWGEYACPHSNIIEMAAMVSTCITPGHGAYVRCADCRMLLSGSDALLPLGDHAYDNACDADCNVCGDLREIAHDYRDTQITPDCENSGYTIHTCQKCGDSYVDSRVDALGHNYVPLSAEPPTCVTDGFERYICQNCGDSYAETISATGKHTYEYGCDETCNVCGYVRNDAHTFIFMGTVEPTCGEDGSDGYKCWACGSVKYVIIPATGKHTYDGVCDGDCNVCGQHREGTAQHDYRLTATVEATCTTDGKYTYTCAGCGDSYSDVIVAPGHKYGVVITPPDCENGGYTTHTCSVCGYSCVDNRVDALGHSYNAVVTAPDCVNGGYTTYTCRNCGDAYTADATAALGHNYKCVVTNATCTADGKKVYTCQKCGDSYVDSRVDALGHSYSAVVTAPDCVNGGYTTYTCRNCGDSYTADATAALGHNYTCVVTNATCTADGKKVYTCQNCGDSYTETIPAVGHSYNSVVTAPDCENGGYTTYTCQNCGDSYTADATAALGHVYDNDRDADCNVCGHVREVTIPGDVTGDGKITNRDLAKIQQYMTGWITDIDMSAADVDDNGKITNRDLAKIQQYMTGWITEL